MPPDPPNKVAPLELRIGAIAPILPLYYIFRPPLSHNPQSAPAKGEKYNKVRVSENSKRNFRPKNIFQSVFFFFVFFCSSGGRND